jgi:hypothetical protein
VPRGFNAIVITLVSWTDIRGTLIMDIETLRIELCTLKVNQTLI